MVSYFFQKLLSSACSSLWKAGGIRACRLANVLCPARYMKVQHSQHLTQADSRIFGAAYVAQCFSVNGQAAFLDEDSDDRHIEYFQGLERFHEQGLPNKLPADRREYIEQDPHVRELAQKAQSLRAL
jgi:hypothetical protein